MSFNSPEEEWSARLQLDKNDRLFTAVAEGHVQKVKDAINNGADVNADRSKALRLAAGQGLSSIVSILLHEGVDISPLDHAALRAAVKGGHQDVAGMLLGKKANPDAGEGEGLIEAASTGRLSMVNLLLSYDADPRVGDDQALRQAAFNGHTEIVRALVQHGADVFAMHGSALSLAQADKHEEVVQYLAQIMHSQREYFRDFLKETSDKDIAGFARSMWQEASGRDSGEPVLIRALKMNTLTELLERMQEAGDGLTPDDLDKLKDREGRSFLQLVTDRAQHKKVFDSALWPNRFDEMVACWEKLPAAQRAKGGMNAQDMEHLTARKNQNVLKDRAGRLNLKPKSSPKPPQP